MSASLIVINENFSVDGVQTLETLATIKQNYKSVVYLACDSSTDEGIPGGYSVIKDAFPEGHTAFIPLDGTCPLLTDSVPINVVQAVHTYGSYERVFDRLPHPTLVLCKTGARASAAVVIYLALKNKWNTAHTRAFSEKHGK